MTLQHNNITFFSKISILTGTLTLLGCASQPPLPCSTTAEAEEVVTETSATPVITEADRLTSFKSYLKNAAQGDPWAQYNLGVWYEDAHPNQPRDLFRAYIWYRLSASQGMPDAQYSLERFEAQLTPAQRTEAERRITNWRRGDTLEK